MKIASLMNPVKEAKKPGFTLVETLVAISILLTVISSIMALIDQSITSGGRLSDQLTASYLASDVVEYLRYDRDSYWLADDNNKFDDWLYSELNCGSQCQIDTRIGVANNVKSCCNPLHYNPGSERYGYNSAWEESKFTRRVDVQPEDLDGDGDTEEARITVTVNWETPGGGSQSLEIKDTLTAWGD